MKNNYIHIKQPDIIDSLEHWIIHSYDISGLESSSLFQALVNIGYWSKETPYGPIYETITTVMRTYHVGATVDGYNVFPQIDMEGNVRTAITKLYSLDCRPIEGTHKWMHFEMKKQGLLPDSFRLSQCPFGAHELPKHPTAKVCIVPDEATAIIGKLCLSEHVWLGVGRWLRSDMLRCLQGRNVMLYPDADLYQEWATAAQRMSSMFRSYTIYDWKGEPQHSRKNIADVFIEYMNKGTWWDFTEQVEQAMYHY